MLSRINPFDIASDHVSTFRHFDDGSWAVGDLVVQFGIPLAVGVTAHIANVTFGMEGVSLLVTSLSVFVGLLFNLLVLATTLRIADRRSVIFSAAKQLSREVLVHTEFAICVAFFAILFLLPAAAQIPVEWMSDETKAVVCRWGSSAVAMLVTLFLLTLLMILRRMHTVLNQHFEESMKEPEAPRM